MENDKWQMKNDILLRSKYIYLVGIKGVGMTALAQILMGRGRNIGGSDTEEKFFTDEVLGKLGIAYREGFKASNLAGRIDLLIYSMAFNPDSHPEIIAAKKRGVPVISYAEALASLFNTELGIAVSGTHGKTTTSALIAESLKALGLDPTALIGSRVANWKTNAITGKSPLFVIEADEHQNKLRFYRPWSIVLTNIDYDHPDYYKKPENYYRAFKKWVGKWQKSKSSVAKIGVFNGDDAKTRRLLRELKLKSSDNLILLTYGTNKGCDFIIHPPSAISLARRGNKGEVYSKINIAVNSEKGKQKVISIKTALIGEHNAYNLAAAFAFGVGLNKAVNKVSKNLKSLSLADIAKSLESFKGTERRMQYLGQKGKVLVYDDYAHHPEEIRTTLKAVKETYPEHQLLVIFQPHTYTRTQSFLADFAKSLKIADQICFLPIYGSARENSGNISSHDIAKRINIKKEFFCFTDHQSCLEFLKSYRFKKPTILVTMGAGDGWRVGKGYLKM